MAIPLAQIWQVKTMTDIKLFRDLAPPSTKRYRPRSVLFLCFMHLFLRTWLNGIHLALSSRGGIENLEENALRAEAKHVTW